MKILIMCGGRGKRLGKLTERVPKPLIKFHNRSILEIKIDHYFKKGFTDFIICTGYKGEMIREAVTQIDLDINYSFSDAGENAGILKRLFQAKDLFEDHVLMTYGDTFTDLNLNQLLDVHKNYDNEATIVVAPIQNPFGLVEFSQNNKVTYFKEKPILNYYIGYAVINKLAFELIPLKIIDLPDGEGLVIFYKILMAMQKLGVFNHTGLQVTFNTQEELKLAEKELIQFYTTPEEY